MSRRRHSDDVYEDDGFYEQVDRRRRSRDDRYLESEFGPRRRPLPVREIDERVLRRQRDRSAPGFVRESVLPRRDEEDVPPPRRRDRVHPSDLQLERETEEVFLRRRTPPPRSRPRRVSRDEVVFDEVDDYRRRPREKERVVFEERRSSRPPREETERDEVIVRKRDRSLPPRWPREGEDIIIENDRRRYDSSDSEAAEDERIAIRHRHRHHHRPSLREDDVERERIKLHRRSVPPLKDYQEEIEEKEDKVVFRHRDRSSSRRRGDRFLPSREEEREEEIVFEERDWSPHRRGKREKFVVRHDDRSPPRRRRDDDVDDVLIRRRSRSIPEREEGRDEVVFRHKHHPSRSDDDREEGVIQHRDRSAPTLEDDRDEIRIRRHHRSSGARAGYEEEDEDEDEEVVLRRRSAHSIDDSRERVTIRRDKHGRRLSLNANAEEDDLIIRDRGRDKEESIEFRHGRGPHHSPVRSHSRHDAEEIIIREDDRGRPLGRNEVDREIIIRKDEERSPSPESVSEPPVIRKPPIVQELITHHRHIDSYETIPPPRQRALDERSLAEGSEEIEIKRRDKSGRHTEEIIIDHQTRERSISPPRRRHSPPEEFEKEEEEKETLITRTISGNHGRERETIIRESEMEREIMPKEDDRVGSRYAKVKEKRDRLWTEIAKDLVVREAIERSGYEFEETEHFYYVFDYLRYNDVERLVDLSDAIRQARRERIRGIRRERETLPQLPVIPGPPHLAPRAPPPPLLLERAPAREPHPWEERERFRERDVIIDEGRRPRRYREV